MLTVWTKLIVRDNMKQHKHINYYTHTYMDMNTYVHIDVYAHKPGHNNSHCYKKNMKNVLYKIFMYYGES